MNELECIALKERSIKFHENLEKRLKKYQKIQEVSRICGKKHTNQKINTVFRF